VVVDGFSKLVKFAQIQTNAMVTRITKLFFKMWVWHNGMPKVIMNDQDVKFMLEFWTLLMKKAWTKLIFITFFHPQIDGQIKRVNEILNQYLLNCNVDNCKVWVDHLGLMEFCYNSTKHSIIKINPFELALGVEVK
jgi:hypothetical protein